MPYTLGVDLGTTSSAAAIKRDERLEPCLLGEATMTVPSIVLPRDDGRTLIGEAAAMHGGVAPVRTARFAGVGVTPGAGAAPALPPDTAELVSLLLDAIVHQATDGEGGRRPERVVIARPAVASDTERELFDQLARDVLSEEVLLVTAPVAAATMVAREYHMGPGTTLGLIDLSGDLCEVSLVCRTDDGLEILGEPATTPGVTGAEVDTLVFRHIDAALGNMVSALDPAGDADGIALQRLATACRQAGQQLLYEDEAVIEVGLPRLTARVHLTRRDLQKLIRPRLNRGVSALERVVGEASLRPDDLHAVVLVGGPARLALASELVAERFACPVVVDALPEMTVALGAALRGAPDDEPPETTALPTIGDVGSPGPDGADGASRAPEPVAALVTANPAPDDGTDGDAAGVPGGRRVDRKLVLASLVLVALMLVTGGLAVTSLSRDAGGDPVDSVGSPDGDGTGGPPAREPDTTPAAAESSTTTTSTTSTTTTVATEVTDSTPGTTPAPAAPPEPSVTGDSATDDTTNSSSPPPVPAGPNSPPANFPELPPFDPDAWPSWPDHVHPPRTQQAPPFSPDGSSNEHPTQDFLTSLFDLFLG